MTPIQDVLSIIQYWKGVAECDCESLLPHGSCLLCDMKRLEKLLEAPKFLPKIPQGYHYAGVYRFKSLLSANQAEVAYIDERGNFAWAGPNNVQNKSENEFVHTIFQNK